MAAKSKKKLDLPVIRDKKWFLFLMTDKHQSELYLENCIQRNIDDKIKKYLIKTSEVIVINRVIITV